MKDYLKLLFLLYSLTGPVSGFAQKLYLDLKLQHQDTLYDLFEKKRSFENFSALQENLEKTLDSVQKIGFFDAKMAIFEQKNDSLYIGKLEMGSKTSIIRVRYQDSIVAAYAKKRGFQPKNSHFLVPTADFEAIMADFTAMEAASGHPLSASTIKNITRHGDTLYTTLFLKREHARKMDKIVINGYPKFPRSYINRYASLKKGELFNKTKINQKADQLADLPFVSQLKDPEVLFEQDSTTVFLYFEKNPANRFDGFLGFGNSEDSGKLRLDGYLDLHLQNNLNYGELLELNYKSDGNDQQTLRVALELPYLFRSPLGLQAELNLFRRDTTFSTSRQEVGLFYQFQGNTRLQGGVILENSTSLNAILNQMETPVDYKKTLYNLGFSRISRSREKIFPVKNSITINTSFGKRDAIGTSENQFAIEGAASYIFNLSQKQRFYVANTTKNLISETYYNNELFRFGGINSIRGFKENAINADLYSVFRTEYRYLAAPSLYIHSVADAAYFENELLDEQGFLYSFGVGAGILTGAGLLNINLANGLQEDQDFKFSNSILHIRLTTFF